MSRITFALLATAAALAAGSAARADTRVSIGVNVGPVYRPAPPVVAYVPAPTVVVAPRGYWKEVQVRTWVPERWIVRHNRWGRAERICEPGHYVYHTDRVWVATNDRHDRHDHDRRDNDRGRGYGYSDRDGRGWNR
jgi:hypothetical protein